MGGCCAHCSSHESASPGFAAQLWIFATAAVVFSTVSPKLWCCTAKHTAPAGRARWRTTQFAIPTALEVQQPMRVATIGAAWGTYASLDFGKCRCGYCCCYCCCCYLWRPLLLPSHL